MILVGLILAAGASRRMGTPKALLEFEGETFADRLIGLLAAHCSPVIVVLGHDAGTIRSGIRRAGEVTFAVNSDPSRGMLSSLQCGLASVASEAEGVLFTPVDHPAVKASTVEAIAGAFQRRSKDTLLAIPTCGGRHGHPVCLASEVATEILALPPAAQARDVIHRRRDRTHYVEVDDPGIFQDADDPEAYRRLLKAVRQS